MKGAKITERQKEEKMQNMRMQEKINEEGQKKWEAQQAKERSETREELQRGIFNLTLSQKQAMDLPRKTFSGFPLSDEYIRNRDKRKRSSTTPPK